MSEQGSVDWLFERVGCVTASRFKDVVSKQKSGKPTAEREKYLWELVIERLTGQPADHFTSAAMEYGAEQEQYARMAYEAHTGLLVEEVGFVRHPEIPLLGGSPDGVIGDDGGWEAKCPYNSANHLKTIRDGMPEEHMAQVQGSMWLNGRQWWDFVSFDPRMPAGLQLYVQRVPRDDAYIAALEKEVRAFLAEVAQQYDEFKLRMGA